MEVINSLDQLCRFLISTAFRRCRMVDDLCRLSISLRPAPPLLGISVSDTGIGSTLEEFQVLKYQNDSTWGGNWDGVLSIANTRICDEEMHYLKFDLKEVVSSRRLARLSSASKNGAKFSGTEVSFSVFEETDGMITMLSSFVKKILLLRAPKIAVELIVESGGKSQPGNIVLQNPCSILPMRAANIDYLKLGLEDYVSKHGNRLAEACQSCFSAGTNLKVGSGVACSRGKQQSSRQVMEVVIVISETPMSDEPSCSWSYGRKSEVLYFRDFTPCSISQPSLDALTSIEWKDYGLVLKIVGDEDGVMLLEWDNLPPCSHIDIVLHNHRKQLTTLPCSENTQIDRMLTRKAVKLALTELKTKNPGIFLSERAVKICKYAPDLAKTITGLIMSSNDSNFQAECLSLLGLQSERNEKDAVENCIKDKIISVVAANDREFHGTKQTSTLFSDEAHPGLYMQNVDYEESGMGFKYLDL